MSKLSPPTGEKVGAGCKTLFARLSVMWKAPQRPEPEFSGSGRCSMGRCAVPSSYRTRTVVDTVPPFTAEYWTFMSPVPRTRYSTVFVVRPGSPLRTMTRFRSF